MAKEQNPVTAHAKAQKKAEQKKSKAATLKARTERLAKRNPARLEKQIAELKSLETNGSLRPKEQEQLKHLERELSCVRRAREQGGDGRGRDGRDGDRRDRRDGDRAQRGGAGMRGVKRDREKDESDTDEEVRRIPMPRDTPPPIPRRENRGHREGGVEKKDTGPAQVTYSSAPMMRDLRKEATAKFAPAQVRRNLERVKGKGGLVEEEEWERLEKGGYTGVQDGEKVVAPGGEQGATKGVTMEEVEDEDL
ncbi:putative WW domain-binding protein [Elsinoe fawcettii]|nr:putative WW domain-binding protein [Elsinoe fawcettii]